MGDTTTNRGYRQPQSTDDPANLTTFWRNLAEDVDADVQTVIDDQAAVNAQLMGTYANTDTISFSSASSHVETIPFGVTLPHAPVHVDVNIASGQGSTTNWVAHADSFTATSFRVLLQGPSAVAWVNIPITFAAVYQLS